MANYLILGHGRHGKDTLADLMAEHLNISVGSSSEIANTHAVYQFLKDKYGYENEVECFNDRSNHRAEWFNLIKIYNKNDPARLAKVIFSEHDAYVGLRSRTEYDAIMALGIVDVVIWVDACDRLPVEDISSMELTQSDASIIVGNDGTEEAFNKNVKLLCKTLHSLYHS